MLVRDAQGAHYSVWMTVVTECRSDRVIGGCVVVDRLFFYTLSIAGRRFAYSYTRQIAPALRLVVSRISFRVFAPIPRGGAGRAQIKGNHSSYNMRKEWERDVG